VRLVAFFLPLLCIAQAPTIGLVEVYGVRKLTVASVLKTAGATPGGRLPASKADLEEKLASMPGVQDASVEAACCEAGKIILYIGIAEKGGAALAFRSDPTEGPDVPEPVTAAYRRFLDAVTEGIRAGVTGEDLSEGYSLMNFAPARKAQQALIPLANQFQAELKNVLRTSSSEDHRAMAAYVLGYHDDKKSVIEDLTYALRDGDATVRENALRALAAIAMFAQSHAGSGIVVDAGLLVEMLNSRVWTDRNNASVLLVSLTESRPVEILAMLRKQALPSLVEMARGRHAPHALSAYILLGRTAGIAESELQSAWANGQRDRIIARASGRSVSGPLRTSPTQPDRPK
jgi:hypothetical protein